MKEGAETEISFKGLYWRSIHTYNITIIHTDLRNIGLKLITLKGIMNKVILTSLEDLCRLFQKEKRGFGLGGWAVNRCQCEGKSASCGLFPTFIGK